MPHSIHFQKQIQQEPFQILLLSLLLAVKMEQLGLNNLQQKNLRMLPLGFS
jgi:hypothetical protein